MLLQLASALKLWLRCLPEPLLQPQLAAVLLQAQAYLSGLERLRVLQQIFAHVRVPPLPLLPSLGISALLAACKIFLRRAWALPCMLAPSAPFLRQGVDNTVLRRHASLVTAHAGG